MSDLIAFERLMKHVRLEAMDRLIEEGGQTIGWEKTPGFCDLIRDAEAELSRLQSLSDQNRLTGGWRDIGAPRHIDDINDVVLKGLAVEEALLDLMEVHRAVFGTTGSEPDVYADYDRCVELGRKSDTAIKTLSRLCHNNQLAASPPLPGGEEKR